MTPLKVDAIVGGKTELTFEKLPRISSSGPRLVSVDHTGRHAVRRTIRAEALCALACGLVAGAAECSLLIIATTGAQDRSATRDFGSRW